MILSLEQAIALQKFLSTQCVSYYDEPLRDALRLTIVYLDVFIAESEIKEEQFVDYDIQ